MAISTNGRISLYCFCVNLTVVMVPLLGYINRTMSMIVEDYWIIMSIVYGFGIQMHIAMVYKSRGYAYRVAWRSGVLGFFLGLGLLIFGRLHCVFGIYAALLSFFHFSEYLTTAIINPKSLSLDSFLLNHSREYAIAAACSWAEFGIEWFFFPSLKSAWWCTLIGVLLCVGGEVLRKGAMWTAGTNFNHIIQSHREEGHVLVTRGPYAICRHPSYVGWFWWAIGTQVVLCNPLCVIVYTCASWQFFQKRIMEEEITLLNFFGEDYLQYQRKVHTGLPFIQGYRIEL